MPMQAQSWWSCSSIRQIHYCDKNERIFYAPCMDTDCKQLLLLLSKTKNSIRLYGNNNDDLMHSVLSIRQAQSYFWLELIYPHEQDGERVLTKAECCPVANNLGLFVKRCNITSSGSTFIIKNKEMCHARMPYNHVTLPDESWTWIYELFLLFNSLHAG